MPMALINTTLVMPNITSDAMTPMEGLFSSPIELISFTLSILGIIANVTAIVATVNVPNNKTTHSKLIISLCVSDGLILIAIPLKYILKVFPDLSNDCGDLFRPILYIGLIATLINLLAMALDHYVAIMRPLHHRRLLSNFRGNFIVMAIWAFSITAGLLEIIIGVLMKAESGDTKTVCEIILTDLYDLEIFIIGFIFVVLIIIIIIYTRIYIQLKSHALVGIPRKQTTKALVTTVLLIGTFTICWAPTGIFQIYANFLLKTDINYMIEHLEELHLVNGILLLILQMNSIIDPLIYAIRLPQVRTRCHRFFSSHKYETRQEITIPLSPLRDSTNHYLTVIND